MTEHEARQIIIDSFLASKLIDDAERTRLMQDGAADVDLAALPIDSLKIVDLCMALENKLNREVQVEELVEHDSLNRLAKHLASTG